MACGFLPDVLVGVVVAPVIDRGRKKRWIVAMDAALLVVYLLMAAATRNGSFRYGLYVAFSRTATVCSKRASFFAAFSTSTAVVPSAMVTASR